MPGIRFKILAKAIKADKNSLYKTHAEILQGKIRAAAREYVKTLHDTVPVWRGFTQGSIKPLAAALSVPFSINPTISQESIKKNPSTAWQNPSSGQAFGKFTLPIASSRRTFKFNFTSTIPYYHRMDTRHVKGNFKNATPWKSQVQAAREFKAELKQRLKNGIKMKIIDNELKMLKE